MNWGAHHRNRHFVGRRRADLAGKSGDRLHVLFADAGDDALDGFEEAAHFGEHQVALAASQKDRGSAIGAFRHRAANEEQIPHRRDGK
ncbi:MAG: hypothetical protein IPL47_13035 [Phyllobacteriaceae bacterium]|nr:hypothetical protein [Phyllobacteriaceae bacterium]